MLRFSSKFGVAFLALALTALVSILAACGDSGSGSGPSGDSSSSRLQLSSMSEPNRDTIQIQNFRANPNLMHTSLTVSGEILIYEDELEYYYVQFDNGKKIINNTTSLSINEYYEFYGEEFCSASNDVIYVQLFVKLKSRSQPQEMGRADFTRDWNMCRPLSSSSAPSSSSADTRLFVPLLLDGQTTLTLNAASGTRGVSFSTNGGTGKSTTGESHIYYEKPSTQGNIRAGSGVSIVTEFARNNDKGCFTGERFMMSPDNFSAGEISNPQNNFACFGIGATAQPEETLGFRPTLYFVVRTNGASGTQWTSNDYLVAFTNERDASLNTAKIVAWKLQ